MSYRYGFTGHAPATFHDHNLFVDVARGDNAPDDAEPGMLFPGDVVTTDEMFDNALLAPCDDDTAAAHRQAAEVEPIPDPVPEPVPPSDDPADEAVTEGD